MSSPETVGATKPSLAQDWLSAMRYWLRGRNGVIAIIVLAVVIGAVLNWSWLVAGGVVPFLVTVLPCAVMCGLGLCMNKMAGGSCSTSSNAGGQPGTPPNATQRITAASPPAASKLRSQSRPKPALCRTIQPSALSSRRPIENRKS